MCVHEPCLLDSLSPQAYGETTTHTLSDMQCEMQCACVRAHADVNKIGLVERLKGLVLGIKGFLCIVYVCESNCLGDTQ